MNSLSPGGTTAFDTRTLLLKMQRPVGACFWNTFGLISQPAYRRRWAAKLDWYRAQGVLPEDEGEGDAGILVTTSEENGIDSAGIEHKLRALLGL